MLKITNQIRSTLKYVPLKHVQIESILCSFAADVRITQIFQNDDYTSNEVIYCFPIDEQAAIYNFTARIDNREITAQLKEKQNTHFACNKSLRQDPSQIYLLEQDENLQDQFIINLGNLPPSKECRITIAYVTELNLIQGSIIRFVIPTIIAPRYNPQKQNTISSTNTKSKYFQSSLYKVQFNCSIEKLHGPNHQQYIARINSPSHHVDIDLSRMDVYLVTFVEQNTYLDRDIILDIQLSDQRANTFVVVESDAAMAAVTPFEEDCYLKSNHEQINEFIFILDCSRSMKNENRIGLVREAMLHVIKNLPENCYFNMIKFGTKYDCLFYESTVLYNRLNRRIAEKFISQIRADLHGTEILAPLQWLERHPPKSDHLRQVFFLTDGAVSNVSEILELCRSMAYSTRIFSFGLGSSPSRALIKGLARTTNGRFVFIPPNANIDIYVQEQLQQAIRRPIKNIRVKWNLGINVQNVPNHLPPAYINDRLIIYALTNNDTITLNQNSSIEIRTDQSYYHLHITHSDQIITSNKAIARLAAKALILELEYSKLPKIRQKKVRFKDIADSETIQSKDDIKQRIIALSIKYNILSRYTAFIGIENYNNNNNNNGIKTNVREIPIQISNQSNNFKNNDINVQDIDNVDLYPSTPLMNTTSRTRWLRANSLPLSNTLTTNHVSPSPHRNSHLQTKTKAKTYDKKGDIHLHEDKNIVQYLINQQTKDNLWNFDSNTKVMEDLTGKSFSVFQSCDANVNIQILVTAIIIILLEVRYSTLITMWEEATDKARQRLINLLNNDWKRLVVLFRNIRIILNE